MMNDYQIVADVFSDEDFINISGLKRLKWCSLWHPNSEFLKTLEYAGIQVYLLEGTIYGCFINKVGNSKNEVEWFGHHISTVKNHEGKMVPNSTVELYQILELCEPTRVEGILFNMNLLIS